MTTITITTDVTATLTDRRARQWFNALAATENRKLAVLYEDLDWEDLEDCWSDEWEAWEKFFS